jgi:flavin reductase (DIM6/NTAB) family NADH-FMN oxidoreductase RutF
MTDSASLRATLRLWASGVSVVTTRHEDQLFGMTVSAFNSLSLDPPQILVCLSKDAHTAGFVLKSGVFAVSILAQHMAVVSDRFAGRIPVATPAERFDGVPTQTAVTGAPILSESIAWLDCRIDTIHDGNTHWIVIGGVQATGTRAEAGAPLLYYARNYHGLGPTAT